MIRISDNLHWTTLSALIIIFCTAAAEATISSQNGFAPRNYKECVQAIDKCIEQSRKGLCSDGPYGPIGEWDVTRVTYMASLFSLKTYFNADISRWDVSSVTDMSSMFQSASIFNADISRWNVSSVVNIGAMFWNAKKFNADISKWDVSSVTDMSAMLYLAQAFTGDISHWDVSNVISMVGFLQFTKTYNPDISQWNVSSVTDMSSMFYRAEQFDADISQWDVSRVTNMGTMFFRATQFKSADISKWNVSRVTNMNMMFHHAEQFDADISQWDVSRVTNTKMMFKEAENFKSDMSKWDVSRVTDTDGMFYEVFKFNADISQWDVSKVTTMSEMFSGASSFDADISQWNTALVTNMNSMFSGATLFNTDISQWDVSNVTNMGKMFSGALDFNADLSQWDVSRVNDMSEMFSGASSFDADISRWDVSRVTDMERMFYSALSFSRTLCGAAWVNSSVARAKDVFSANAKGSVSDTVCTTTTSTPSITSLNNGAAIVGVVVGVFFGVVVLVIVVVVLLVKRKGADAKPKEQLLSLQMVSMSNYQSSKRTVARVPSGQRTFATSNYKRFYDTTERAAFQHRLLGAVNDVLELYAARVNPTLSRKLLADGVHAFMEDLQDDAFKNNKALKNNVDAVAEYLWTSAKTHDVVFGRELCSVLNSIIRDDIEAEIKASAAIIRSINSRRVRRESNGVTGIDPTYPPNGQTWRGGGFRKQFRPFFERTVGHKYRVPGFLATSSRRVIAINFANKADKDHPRALWRIVFDPRGKSQPEYRVQHMTFVSKTLVRGEREYLFAPYSVFKLVSVEWSEMLRKPHEFVIEPALDNREEDESLPLAPWY